MTRAGSTGPAAQTCRSRNGLADCGGGPDVGRHRPDLRRYYKEDQLLRLQQILVLRALGVGLPEIGRILSEQVDEVDALRGHHQRLLAERDRLDALAATVSRTIAELEQSRKDGNPMTINRPENLFEGVTPTQYEENMRLPRAR